MKALSIRQPWAWAILYAGKRIENRTWSTNYRGPLLIHAARGMTSREYCDAFIWMSGVELIPKNPNGPTDMPIFDKLDRGGIVGKSYLIDIYHPHEYSANAFPKEHLIWWDQNQYGWLLDKVEPLPFHPCRGRQGLFEVDYAPK